MSGVISGFLTYSALYRVMGILLDQVVVEDTEFGQIRKMTFVTTAINPFVAKQKTRVFVQTLRPHRKIQSFQIQELDGGLLIKSYQVEVKLALLTQQRQLQSGSGS